MASVADDILLGRLTGAEVVRISCTAATTCLAAGLLSSRDSRQQYLDRASLLVQYLAARYPSFLMAGTGEGVVVQLLVHRVLQLFTGQQLLQQEQVNRAQQALEQFQNAHGPVQVWCLLQGMNGWYQPERVGVDGASCVAATDDACCALWWPCNPSEHSCVQG